MLTFFSAICFLFGVILVLPGANQAEMARELELGLVESGLLGPVMLRVVGEMPLY